MLQKESGISFVREELIAGCVQALCKPRDLEASIAYILQELGSVLLAKRAYLYCLDKEGWRLIREWRSDSQETGNACGQAVLCGKPPVWKAGEPLLLESLEPLQVLCPSFGELIAAAGATSVAAVPLGAGGNISGCLGVENPSAEMLQEAGPLLRTLCYSLMAAQQFAEDALALENMRLYDGPTGAFRRESYFKELEAVQAELQPLGIARFKIVGMRKINERYGQVYGEEMLLNCVRRATGLLLPGGKLYRVGFNEFAAVCLGVSRETFEALAMQLNSSLEEVVACPIAIGYQWTSRPRTSHQLDLAAEAMMEEEKQKCGKIDALSGCQRILAEDPYGMLTVESLTSLLQEERFIVHLQPKLSFQNGELVGAEALVRFLDGGTIVEPGRFLPDLEAAMLIKYLDFYVFEQACQLIRAWQERRPNSFTPISVNFSKMTLEEPNLVTRLLHLCRRNNVEPYCLEVEIGGSMEKIHSGSLSKVVDKIRAAGFTVSVDDFGIRFANLSLLIALDCDKLKVDRSLVGDVATSPKARSVLRALAALGAATGTKTTVEGIETEDQLHMLKNMGFDEMQGYLISQPLSAAEFEKKYLCNS